MAPITERDEFLLSRLLDGDLPTDEAAALRARLDREPALRAAFEALVRIDALLADRRTEPVQVDWRQFCAKVMERVGAEPASSAHVLWFPVWLRVAMPVAAAAAIALVVVLRTPEGAPAPAGVAPPAPPVAYHRPASPVAGEADTLVVRYHRPGPAAAPGSAGPSEGPIDVAYPRSPEIEEEIRRVDEARDKAPSSRLYMVQQEEAFPLVLDLLELPL